MRDWRTWRAKNQDIQVTERIGPQTYRVNGQRGINYRVNIKEVSCTCPDWRKREPTGGCKHIRAVFFAVDTGTQPPPNGYGDPHARFIPAASSAYPDDWEARRRKVYQRDEWTCQNCGLAGGSRGEAQLEAHHIVPVGKGGTHTLSNLVMLCTACHETVHGQATTETHANAERNTARTSSSSKRNTKPVPRRSTTTQDETIEEPPDEPLFEELSALDPTHGLPPWSESHPEPFGDQVTGSKQDSETAGEAKGEGSLIWISESELFGPDTDCPRIESPPKNSVPDTTKPTTAEPSPASTAGRSNASTQRTQSAQSESGEGEETSQAVQDTGHEQTNLNTPLEEDSVNTATDETEDAGAQTELSPSSTDSDASEGIVGRIRSLIGL